MRSYGLEVESVDSAHCPRYPSVPGRIRGCFPEIGENATRPVLWRDVHVEVPHRGFTGRGYETAPNLVLHIRPLFPPNAAGGLATNESDEAARALRETGVDVGLWSGKPVVSVILVCDECD